MVRVSSVAGSDKTKGKVQTPLDTKDFTTPMEELTREGNLKLTPSYEHKKEREKSQYQVGKDILIETNDEEAIAILLEVQKAIKEKFRAEQEAIQLKLQQEKLQREQEELAHKQAEELLLKEQQQRIELEKEKALLEEQQKKTQELKDRMTPENIKDKAKIESDIEKAKIRRKDIEKDFWKRLTSVESIQKLEGTVGHLTETEVWKIQLRKVKLKVRL